MLRGNFRSVFFIGNFAIKVARGFDGFISNLSEWSVWLSSNKKARSYLAKTYFSCGFFNVQEKCYFVDKGRARHFLKKVFNEDCYWTVLNDTEQKNVGRSKKRKLVVKIDYADHWFLANFLFRWCSFLGKQCEDCRSRRCIKSNYYEWRNSNNV